MAGWFERQQHGRSEREVLQEHARYLRAAGVDRALDALAGPFGLRRFLVYFAARPVGAGRHSVEVQDLQAVGLAAGGGPPPADPSGDKLMALERALTRLHANMSLGPAWKRGVVGYVRDSGGHTQVLPLFDEDSDGATVDALPVPGGRGHPLEQPEYSQLLANWEARLAPIQARTSQIGSDWDLWSVEDGTLTLCFDPLPSEGGEERWRDVRRYRCEPLATFQQQRLRFTWQTARRPGSPALFADDVLVADWGRAFELALLTAAGLGASWLFAGEFGDAGSVLYVAVFEG